jgi:hypothetical protein
LVFTLAMGSGLIIALLWLLGSSPTAVTGTHAPVMQPAPRDVIRDRPLASDS